MKLLRSIISFSVIAVSTSIVATSALGDLVAMQDEELSMATGEGLGLALQDFILDSDGAELKVTGIKDSNGGEIDIDWTSFYIMGEGSQKGSVATTTDIGSYLNPWVFRSVRGSRGLNPTDADYDERYSSIGNDVALLEIATDSYQNPVQQSALFGEFSRYQGCVYGEPGCQDLGFDGSGDSAAERAIQSEIDLLIGTRSEIQTRYGASTTVNFIQSDIDNVYNQEIQPRELVVEQEQEDVGDAITVARTSYNQMTPQEREEISFLTIPESCSAQWFGSGYNCDSNAQEDYAVTVDDVNDEKAQLRAAKADLNSALNNESYSSTGESYLTMVSDVNEFKSICGYGDQLSDCEGGQITRKQGIRDDIETIAFSLSNGQARRSGMDIGLTFEFDLNLAGGGTRNDFLDIDMRGVFIDGTSFKLWSRPSTDPSAPGSELLGELRLNLFAKELDIRACDDSICNTEALREANTLNMDNFVLSLNLGYGDVQPVKFSATSEGHFQLKLENPDWTNEFANPDGLSAEAFYQDYYENAPKSYLHIGDVRVGNTSLGSSTISGARAQYLSVTTRDL
jgi:hypothetical protein